jgi:hypothetical protein
MSRLPVGKFGFGAVQGFILDSRVETPKVLADLNYFLAGFALGRPCHLTSDAAPFPSHLTECVSINERPNREDIGNVSKAKRSVSRATPSAMRPLNFFRSMLVRMNAPLIGRGRLSIRDAILAEFAGVFSGSIDVASMETRVEETVCWLTWSELAEHIDAAKHSFSSGAASVDAAIDRIASAVLKSVKWHGNET